jgi:hypothetical protein
MMLLDGCGDIRETQYSFEVSDRNMDLWLEHPGLHLSQTTNSVSTINFDDPIYEDEEMLEDFKIQYSAATLYPLIERQYSNRVPPTLERAQFPRPDIEGRELEDALSLLPLDSSSTQNVTDLALRRLIGGRQTKVQPGVKTMKPEPAYTLSRIAPALWSPGFLEVILTT